MFVRGTLQRQCISADILCLCVQCEPPSSWMSGAPVSEREVEEGDGMLRIRRRSERVGRSAILVSRLLSERASESV